MIFFYHQYLQKSFPYLFNEGNINLGFILLFAFISGCFILLKLYRSKQKMKAAAAFIKDLAESDVDTVSYKDGWTKMDVTFKQTKKKDENDSDKGYLKRA